MRQIKNPLARFYFFGFRVVQLFSYSRRERGGGSDNMQAVFRIMNPISCQQLWKLFKAACCRWQKSEIKREKGRDYPAFSRQRKTNGSFSLSAQSSHSFSVFFVTVYIPDLYGKRAIIQAFHSSSPKLYANAFLLVLRVSMDIIFSREKLCVR